MPVAGAIADHGTVGHRLGRARQTVHFATRPWRPGHCAVHAGEYGPGAGSAGRHGRRARQLLRDQLAAWAAAQFVPGGQAVRRHLRTALRASAAGYREGEAGRLGMGEGGCPVTTSLR